MIDDWQTYIVTAAGISWVLFSIVVSGFVVFYGPRGIVAFTAWTSIVVVEHARQVMLGEAQTGAGIIETKIAQGDIKWVDVRPSHFAVVEQASRAIARLPPAVAPMHRDRLAMAETIVGMVRTNSVLPTIVGNALAASQSKGEEGETAAQFTALAIPLVVAGPS